GSSYVDRTVWEAVNGTLQDLLNVFTAGEDAVSFASVDERDADAAKLATQVVNQILLRDNQGYNVLASALKECLVTRNSFVKRYWSEDEKAMTEKVEGVNPDELQAYIQGLEDAGVEKIEVVGTERDDGLIDADVSYVLKIKRVKVDYVPLEEVLVDQWATSIQTATYFAHRTRKTKQELLELGFPEDEINNVTEWNTTEEISQQQIVAWARTDWRNDWHQDIGTDSDDHAQQVWLYEQYVRTSDLNDDGIIRLYQVFDAGDRILEINEVDDIPFETFCPYPIPGTIFGESVYDITKDIQDLRTALI
ncbi:portal protein, partial [Herbiconiux daphne]